MRWASRWELARFTKNPPNTLAATAAPLARAESVPALGELLRTDGQAAHRESSKPGDVAHGSFTLRTSTARCINAFGSSHNIGTLGGPVIDKTEITGRFDCWPNELLSFSQMRPTAAIIVLTCSGWAQFKSTVPLVVAPTTVTDSKGHFVDGLTHEDLILYDNNVPQTIWMDWMIYPISLVVRPWAT